MSHIDTGATTGAADDATTGVDAAGDAEAQGRRGNGLFASLMAKLSSTGPADPEPVVVPAPSLGRHVDELAVEDAPHEAPELAASGLHLAYEAQPGRHRANV